MAKTIILIGGLCAMSSVFLPTMPFYCLLSGEARRLGLVGSAIWHGVGIMGLGAVLILLSRCIM